MKSPQRVLVAEDDLALAQLLTFRFRMAGFAVTTTTNGTDALHRARETLFDAVITDYQMPGITGVELCVGLRETPGYTHIPIILITGKGFELELSALQQSLRLAAAFSKPFSPTRVVRAVKEQVAESEVEWFEFVDNWGAVLTE